MYDRLLNLLKNKKRDTSGFKPHSVLRILVVVSFLLILTMACVSRFDRHPDEIHHFLAAKYYTSHFAPPEIGDPSVRDSYSVWGLSYLNYQWIEYFLAGKFMVAVSPVVDDPVLAARLFNGFLFFGLALWLITRAREHPEGLVLACFLIISPQIWYIFSYVNSDGFALFISLLLAFQIASPGSLTNKFLTAESFKWAPGTLFGTLIGLLLIAKTNYWAFLVFVAIWLASAFPVNRTTLRRFAFAGVIALSVLAFRVALDFYSSGETNFAGAAYLTYISGNFEKDQNRLLAYQEEIAETPFKPSTIDNDLGNTYPGLKLRAKGVTFVQMFTEMRWLQISFESFTGVYGYMDTVSPKLYSRVMALIYLGFGLFLAGSAIFSRDRKSLVQLAALVFSCLLTIFVSAFVSWNYAFQPQGRYLFPIIPMIGIFVCANRRHLNGLAVHIFVFGAFLLSVYSFVFVGLREVNGR